jgi:hypothetical protein
LLHSRPVAAKHHRYYRAKGKIEEAGKAHEGQKRMLLLPGQSILRKKLETGEKGNDLASKLVQNTDK